MENSSNNSNESKNSDSPKDSGTSLVPAKPGYVTPFNEDEAKTALVQARGDIFIAAQILRVTAIRLRRAIDMSSVLQAAVTEIEAVGRNRSVTDAQIHRAIEERVNLYRVDGLDALHDLATMDIDPENSANNQVKLAAAARLAGPTDTIIGAGDMGETFRELRRVYDEQAPRLRVTRQQTTTTVEIDPGHTNVVASQEQTE